MAKKDLYIQAVRGLAIAAVVLIHCLPQEAASVALRPFLNFAVAAFIFLSGYLTPREKTADAGAFLRRRVGKIAAPYAVWTVLYLVAKGALAPLTVLAAFVVGGGVGATLLPRRLPAARAAHAVVVPPARPARRTGGALRGHAGHTLRSLRALRRRALAARPGVLRFVAPLLPAGARVEVAHRTVAAQSGHRRAPCARRVGSMSNHAGDGRVRLALCGKLRPCYNSA